MTAAFEGKYVSLTSFKRDGEGVATPVWFVQEGGSLFVGTDADSGKVKRIRGNPSVTVTECSASGRLRGEPVPARAELLPKRETKRIDELIARKYRLDIVFVLPIYRAVQWIRRGGGAAGDPAVLKITQT
jgi:PPOX class probable F420-dependent enzyme